jgi:hypothetical protein
VLEPTSPFFPFDSSASERIDREETSEDYPGLKLLWSGSHGATISVNLISPICVKKSNHELTWR